MLINGRGQDEIAIRAKRNTRSPILGWEDEPGAAIFTFISKTDVEGGVSHFYSENTWYHTEGWDTQQKYSLSWLSSSTLPPSEQKSKTKKKDLILW